MDSNSKLARRDFFKLSGAAAATLAGCTSSLGATSAVAKMMSISTNIKAPLPKAKGPRLVVVGAGTSGLTIAKYAKKTYPKFDVVMVEKRDMYSSCFSSNLRYADLIDLGFLANHSFLDAARNNNYIFFNATCTGLDRTSRKLLTSMGEIDYDYLVLAPGIDYDYSRIGVRDTETEMSNSVQYFADLRWKQRPIATVSVYLVLLSCFAPVQFRH